MKKYNKKKKLNLEICAKETWIKNNKEQRRLYSNTSQNWYEDMKRLKDGERIKLLYKYSYEGNKKLVKSLLETAKDGFRFDEFDDDNNNVVMYAVKGGNIETVKYLIKLGASVNYHNNLGITPLGLAVRKNHYVMVKAMLDVGANVNIKDGEGNTPLFDAVKENNDLLIKLLIQNGANVLIKNNVGDTILHLMAQDQSSQFIMQKLLDTNRLNVNVKNKLGKTPLYIAIEQYKNNIVDFLLKKGADFNIADNSGKNAIMYAAAVGNKEVLRVLIARGGNFTAVDNGNKTALDYAKFYGHKTCVEILEKASKIYGSNLNDQEKSKKLYEFAKHNKIENSCTK